MEPRYREEVLNVVLAILLHKRGVVAAPELILRQHLEQGRAMPDVLVHYQGLRTAIEGRVTMSPAAEKALVKKAQERVQRGIAHLGIAVVYPELLRGVPLERLEEELAQTRFRFAVTSEAEDVQLALAFQDVVEPAEVPAVAEWAEGTLDDLASFLRRTYERLVKEDVVRRAADSIKGGISAFSEVILASPGSLGRCAWALGIRGSPVAQPGTPGASPEEDGQ